MYKVFLGGTCNGSTWRDELIPMLNTGYFNPVVDDWDEAAYQQELYEREHCHYCLYVITPKMTGVYAIAEVVDDSNKRPEKVIFCPLVYDETEQFDAHQWKSLQRVAQMVTDNGGRVEYSLEDVAKFLNMQQFYYEEMILDRS